jgi:hypothetical protein
MRRARAFVALNALIALMPGALAAQGAVSLQGFGYPTGQLSSGALSMGGASAELDPASALNPAAIGANGRYSVYMQFEPEFRRVALGGREASSSTMRFPAFLISAGSRRFTGGLSATTLLDRTWRNVYSDSQLVGGDLVASTITAASNGAITDARLGGAYWLNAKVQLGLGVHALVGENRLEFGRTFPGNTNIGGVTQLSTISYSGRAVSLGAIWLPSPGFVVGASVRKGGQMEARSDDAPLSKANAPDRFGVTLAWTAIPNTTFAARFDHVAWSAMDGLGTAELDTYDANDLGLGVEVVGPRIGGAPSFARLGLRSRTLPFGVAGDKVAEKSFSGGIGIPLARGRGTIDLTLQRAARSVAGADEKSWFVSLGLGIRP